MSSQTINILLIEDNPGDARLLQETLKDAGNGQFELQHVKRLDEALKLLDEENFGVVLLDLELPDSVGFDTFLRVKEHAIKLPIIVLTGIYGETLAVNAVKAGAQDYLVKGQVDSNLLVRSIRYAIERHRLLVMMRAMSIIDELTGLHNRRGFLTLARQQLHVASRMKKNMTLLFADLDGMKLINDAFGHTVGDQALIDTANLLRETFRQSDIVARIGGDEFTVLAIQPHGDDTEAIIDRLQRKVVEHNSLEHRPYKLSMSVGIATYNPEMPCSIEKLLNQADRSMYEEKRSKQSHFDKG